jgi:aminopeptidase-like protein
MNLSLLKLIEDIWPLSRVHNSPDIKKSIRRFSEYATFPGATTKILKYKAGDQINYWRIPQSWEVESYRLLDGDGNEIASKNDSALSVGCYSGSFSGIVTLQELLAHVATDPKNPNAFVFSFRQMYRHWEQDWRISLPYDVVCTLKPGNYRVELKTVRSDSDMEMLEISLPGKMPDTIVLAGHIDHPCQINDSLSGCLICVEVLEYLSTLPERMFSYKALLVPEIIGSAVYLEHPTVKSELIRYAFCPNVTSHDAELALCRSKSYNSLLDIAFELALHESGEKHVVGSFHKYPDCGDEISFDTVGYKIPTTTLSRIGEKFQQYHSSDDNFERFSKPDEQKRHAAFRAVSINAFLMLEQNRSVLPLFRGNPCLSNPEVDLYLSPGQMNNIPVREGTVLNLKNQPVDLRNFREFFLDCLNHRLSIVEIAYLSMLPFGFVKAYADKFVSKGLAKYELVDRSHLSKEIPTTSLFRANLVYSGQTAWSASTSNQ